VNAHLEGDDLVGVGYDLHRGEPVIAFQWPNSADLNQARRQVRWSVHVWG
jgi:hypothetical protein